MLEVTIFLFTNFRFFLYILVAQRIPETDLVFVVSASSSDSDATFMQIKDIMKYTITKHDEDHLKFGVITAGTEPNISVMIGMSFLTNAKRIEAIEKILKPSGAANLGQALIEAKQVLFESPGARTNATKVVAVLTDKKSESTMDELERAVMSLAEKGVRVLAISVGRETDKNELEIIASNSNDVISTEKDANPKKVAEKIMNKVLKGLWI